MSSSTPVSSAQSSADGSADSAAVMASQPNYDVSVTCNERWEVYHRLQSLDFDCQCSGFQPLQVALNTPAEAIQLWSILRRVSQPRLVLADSLNRCWKAPAAK